MADRHDVNCGIFDPVPGFCDCSLPYRQARQEGRDESAREIEVLRAERDTARARFDHAVKLLTAIHGLLLPADFEHDGKRFRFEPPELRGHLWADAYRALGERIRALPSELDKAKQGTSAGTEKT